MAVPMRRPAVIMLAAVAISVVGTGCASRTANTQLTAKTLPGNQDTAARSLSDARAAPMVPQAPAVAPLAVSPTPIPSTTDPAWKTNLDAAKGMATLLTTAPDGAPVMGMTPQQNPAPNNKPALEVVGIPMWLWINAPALQTTINGDDVVDQVVIDQVAWTMDGAATPFYTCGNTGAGTPAAGQGAGTPYDTSLDPTSPGNTVPACIYSFSTPYYTTSNGIVGEGTHMITAAVNWHVNYTVTNGTGTTGPFLAQPMNAVAVAAAGNLALRVGEIQALAIGP